MYRTLQKFAGFLQSTMAYGPVRAVAILLTVLFSVGVVIADSQSGMGACLIGLAVVIVACGARTLIEPWESAEDEL